MRLLIALFLSCSLVTFAQKSRDHKMVRFEPGDVRAIIQNNVVTGYYFACITVNGEFKRIYGVQLYDKDLQPTYYKEFRTGAYSDLKEIRSDGQGYCLKFYNIGKGKTELIIANSQLEQTGTVTLKNGKGEISSFHTLVSIEGVGFASYNRDKSGFSLNAYTPEGKILWNYTSDYKEKKTKECSVRQLMTTGNLLAFGGDNFRSTFKTDKNDQFLLLLDPKSGQKLLRMNLPNNVGLKQVESVVERPEGYILTGRCYFEKNSGAALWLISKDGILQKERYVNVLEESGKLREAERNKSKYAVDANHIHCVTLFDDNSAIIVSEAAGEKANYLITCSLDQDWKVANVNSVSNIKREVGFIDIDMSDERLFDLRYLVPSSANKFSFVFVESKNSSSGTRVTLVNADVKGSKVERKEHKVSPDVSFYKVLPAKEGHVVICEFFEKEKRLSLKMEEF